MYFIQPRDSGQNLKYKNNTEVNHEFQILSYLLHTVAVSNWLESILNYVVKSTGGKHLKIGDADLYGLVAFTPFGFFIHLFLLLFAVEIIQDKTCIHSSSTYYLSKRIKLILRISICYIKVCELTHVLLGPLCLKRLI